MRRTSQGKKRQPNISSVFQSVPGDEVLYYQLAVRLRLLTMQCLGRSMR